MTSLSDQANGNRTPDLDNTHVGIPYGKHSILTRLSYIIPLIAFPLLYASRASPLVTVIQLRSTSSPSSVSSYTSIDDAWVRYLNARVAEWKVLFTLACVLVGLSLTMYQIPQAANDPLTYAFASLTQCRAFAGLIYAAALHVYFESEYTHTKAFAIVWWRSTMRSNDKVWNTWVMLSLPAASTLWALISYLLAMLTFIFRPSSPTLDNYVMPFGLNTSLKVIVTASIISDLVCLACTWITLKGYRDEYYAAHEDI